MTTATETPTQEQIDESKAILLRAARFCQQGWTRKQYAVNAAGESVPPYAAEACAWCGDGAIIRAQHEIGVSLQSMQLVRKAVTLVCSARRGTPAEPFWSLVHLNDDPKTTQAGVVAALRSAADLLPVAHLVQGCYYPYKWWTKILVQLKKGNHA